MTPIFYPINAWEKRKLGEISDIRGGGTPSTSKPEYWDGEIDWYAPAEIGTQRYVSGSRRQITNLGLNKSSATMLPANKTILFTSRAGIGNAAILTKSGATNQGFQSIVVEPATDVYFLYSEIPEIKRKAIRLAAGSTFLEISGKSLSKIQIWLPSFKEQSRIGHLFLQIDNLIAATQDKLEKLSILQRGFLQHFFAQTWRFSGYSHVWENHRLGDVATRVRGNDGRMNLPILTISAGKGWLTQEQRFSQNIAGNELKKYTLLSKGELSYNHGNSKLAEYGAVFVLKQFKEALVPRVYHSFNVSGKADPDFIEYLFESGVPNHELRKLISSGARMDGLLNINYDSFMNISVLLPSIEEQNKIARVLEKLKKLTDETRLRLFNLQQAKKSLLRMLFP